ncbi:MAG TPA: sigma 54-interacting transcriptional regulator, partial [Blastocatellia bacterium]|nr:sigma 54-interacting transcriptional regulator [Blastocatellia bacterium]
LIIASRREAAFTADDGELLTQIGVQVALAVENALNFETVRSAEIQMEHDRHRLSLLLNITNTIVSRHDLRELIRIISSSVRGKLSHDLMGLSIYDAELNQLRTYMYDFLDNKPFIEDGYLIPLEGSFTGMTFSTGKPFFMNIDYEHFNTDFNKRFREAGFKSGGCVPLVAHGRKLGTLGVVTFYEHVYSRDEEELLHLIGNQVALALENVLAFREIEALKNKLSEEKLYLEEEINTAYDFEQIIGSSPALKRILKKVETVAPTDSTVLIQGETGTGKELIARAIHSLSARRERTLVKINCAAIPTGLIESELFGHEKGAFTGAIAQRIGRFELANKGSLFLDEVGEIPQELQPKLLRVLQEKEFERLGSTRTIKVDIRLIAATNRNLEQMVAERQFRDDLYYRLNVFPITLPSLRERPEDIPLLVRFFASKFARQMKKRIETIPAEAVAALQRHHWHGNIRELENFVERAVIVTQGTELQFQLAELKLPAKTVASLPASSGTATPASPAELTSLDRVEREHILRVLNETDWIVGGPNGAAARLGLKRTTLQARMKKLGIERHRTAP